MRKIAVVGLLALPLLLASGSSASANWPCSFAGCGGHCLSWFGRIHQHGPLFNYGPYSGYYPFEPYGPWTSDLRYNPPPPMVQRHTFPHVHALLHKAYAAVTLQNVWKRLAPLQDKLHSRGGWGHGGHGGGGLFHKHKGGCANGDCAAANHGGPSCTLCGHSAQSPNEGVATVLLTGWSN